MIEEDDWVLIYFDKRRRYTIKVKKSKIFHTDKGVIYLDSLIGKNYGSRLSTNIGCNFILAKPSFLDLLETFSRRTQIIYLKDASLIIALASIGSGSIVVEGGTGSGFLTAFLANFVKPEGRVYTYDTNRYFQKIAEKNIASINLSKYVFFKNKDITKGIDEEDVDAVILDIPNPWDVVKHAYNALKNGGVFICFLPTINQIEKTVIELENLPFIDINTYETFLRHYKVSKGATRPMAPMIAHTGFIISAKKP
ncbi:MAG: hypothetical protein DRJ34_03935 [Thermoprotei archaeon]|nr:MAG: hypothetical protein DRJ34_03935 [Thermoprotei archaeon]